MNKVEARINYNYYRQIADKITQLLDKIHDSQLSDKRWVWELMQNALDVPNKFGRVSILIELWEDKLIFSHNGDYFTDGNITGLIQQVSSKDSANEGEIKQVGKFGTGFITTHLLSDIIDVKGVVKNPNNGEYQNFVLTLDRSARKSEDMIESITQNIEWVKGLDNGNYEDFPIAMGYESRSENDYLTTFTYHLNNDSFNSASIGLSDLINTLPITMVSLYKLKSVRVVNHVDGREQLYRCNSETIYKSSSSKIIRSVIDINGEKKYYLTYKTFEGEEPKVALSIETNWDGKTYTLLKRDKSQPVLFRDFPLIGSEEFYFPYMLNGFDFEPTETRSGILLNSNEPKPQKNRQIIEIAIDSVINFNEWLVASGAKNTYILASSKEPKPRESWDETYAKPWIKKLQETWRSRLLAQNILETKDGYAELKQIRIPDYGTKEANKQFLYFLEGFITEGILPLKKQQEEWAEVIDSNYPSWKSNLKYSKQDFFEDLQRIGCINNLCSRLNKSEKECYDWLNKLFKFIVSQRDISILERYPVIPNQYGDFCQLDKISTDSAQRIPNELKDICVGLFSKDFRDELMSEDIDDSIFATKKEYKLENLIGDINRVIGGKVSNENLVSSSEWGTISSSVYSLLSIKSNGTEEENKKRDDIHQLISHFVGDLKNQTVIDNLPADLWKEAEQFIIKFIPNLIVINSTSIETLGEKLLKYPKVHNADECTKWLNDYGKLAKSLSISIPTGVKIYPNQKGNLESLSVLHYDNLIPEELKDLNLIANAEDWRDKLFDRRICGYEQYQPLSTKDIYESIKKNFESSNTSIEHKLQISNETIVLIPDTKQDDNSDNISFYKLAKAINPSLKDIAIIKNTEGFYWEKFIACVLKNICKEIDECKSLGALVQKLNKTPEETISYIDSVIEYTKNRFGGNYYKYAEEDYAIWLNQNGSFCKLLDVNKDDNIDDTIKDICLNKIIDINYRNKLLRKAMKCEYYIPDSNVITSNNILSKIDEIISRYVEKDRKSLQDKGFAEIVFKLDKLIKKNEDYRLCLPYFNLNHDKLIVGSIGDEKTLAIVGSLVSCPKKMEFLTNLSEDQLRYVIENSLEIRDLSETKQKLIDENEELRKQNTELQRRVDIDDVKLIEDENEVLKNALKEAGLENPLPEPIKITLNTKDGTQSVPIKERQYAGLSLEEIVAHLSEAKQAVVNYLKELNDGWIFNKEEIARDSYSQLYGISDRNGNEIPMVVHSYKGPQYRYFDLNWYDWQLLKKPGAMLWVNTSTGLQCIPFYALPIRNVNISLDSCTSQTDKAKILTLATVSKEYAYVGFEFGNNMPRDFDKPIPFDEKPKELKNCIDSIKEICDNNAPSLDCFKYGPNIPLLTVNYEEYSRALRSLDDESTMREIHDLPANDMQKPEKGAGLEDIM